MNILGKEAESKQYWAEKANDYAEAMQNKYHQHRLSVIDTLIPKELYAPGKKIFDFCCGDAVHFFEFLQAGAEIRGCDIAPEMIDFAKKYLIEKGYDAGLAQVDGVDNMKTFAANSLDAILSFNVLAYLTDDEEKAFYQEAARILKPGGYLIVTHSNELFDLYSLNKYTTVFMEKHFLKSGEQASKVAALLTSADKPENLVTYNVRENPLNYRYKLKRLGFEEIRQSFSNLHELPPQLLTGIKDYPDTLNWPEEDQWKLMFQCSTYGSCAKKI